MQQLLVVDKAFDNIVGMLFDTKSSNMSFNIEAYVLLEEAFRWTLFRLPCRYHILELPIKAGFNGLMSLSTSLTNLLNFWMK